jgi:hypothetical protein
VKRTWYILHFNCDCSSGMEARQNRPRGAFGGMRCPNCDGIIGVMEYDVLGSVQADGEFDAFRAWQKKESKP